MKRPKTLSATFVKTVNQPGRYGDGRGGNGLSLLVKPTSTGRLSKSWAQRLRLKGKPFDIGLGSYPITTLSAAREKALNNARTVAEGGDPRTPVNPVPTFAEALESVISLHRENWKDGGKTENLWRRSLETYALSQVGNKSVSEITSADVLAVLAPIWAHKRPTAMKVRRRVSAVMKWAIAEGHRDDNPAGDAITAALPRGGHVTTHQRALPFAAVGAAIATIRNSGAWPATKLAFELLTLTAARSNEIRLADWNEIDLGAATWTIPEFRMKAGREHRIPLSQQALAVLDLARDEMYDGSGLIFPSPRGKALTDSTISKLLRENNLGCVPHGMRSSFRDWAAECSNVPREIAEHALGHVEGSASELAYRRTDYFERRRELMQQWADFVLPSGDVDMAGTTVASGPDSRVAD